MAPSNIRAAIDAAVHFAESDTRNLVGMLDVPFAGAVSRTVRRRGLLRLIITINREACDKTAYRTLSK